MTPVGSAQAVEKGTWDSDLEGEKEQVEPAWAWKQGRSILDMLSF